MCAPGWHGIPRYVDGEYEDGCDDAGEPTHVPSWSPSTAPSTGVPSSATPTGVPRIGVPSSAMPTGVPRTGVPSAATQQTPSPNGAAMTYDQYRHIVEIVAISAATLVLVTTLACCRRSPRVELREVELSSVIEKQSARRDI